MPETKSASRPHCAVCDVDMWLIRVGTDTGREAYKFECKVCGAQQVLLAGKDGGARLEGGL